MEERKIITYGDYFDEFLSIAEKIGSSKSYISQIENGRVEPSASLFFRIMEALGLRVDITKPVFPV